MDESQRATSVFQVTGMSCSSCEQAVQREVDSLTGVAEARADAKAGTLRVSTIAPVSPATIIAAVDEAGYQAVAIP